MITEENQNKFYKCLFEKDEWALAIVETIEILDKKKIYSDIGTDKNISKYKKRRNKNV